MSLQPLWPVWALAVVLVPILGLTVWRAVAASGERRLAWWRRVGMVLMVAAIGLAPSVENRTTNGLVSNAELYFVVDRTGSMAAQDYGDGKPRLDGVAADIEQLTRDLPGARYSIIAFDSQSTRQLPLTTDARAVRSWAQTVKQERTSASQGSSVDRPLGQLVDTLTKAQERNPANVRLVFFMSDGENTDGKTEFESFAPLQGLIDGGAVLGYGTPEGGKMLVYNGTDNNGTDFIPDPSTGKPAISTIDENTLRTIAQQLGVPYLHRTEPASMKDLVSSLDLTDKAADGRRDEISYSAVVWPFAIVLVLLMGWEAWDLSRTVPKRRTQGTPQPRTTGPERGTA